MTEVRALAEKIFTKYLGRSISELLKADWNKYGLQVVRGDSLAQKLIVPMEKEGKGTGNVKGREIVSELMHENLGTYG
jgi:hypothetical protein